MFLFFIIPLLFLSYFCYHCGE